jgi:hypothetical protein
MTRGALLLAAALAGVSSTGCIFSRMFYYNTPSLGAPSYFDSRTVSASPSPRPWMREKDASFALTESEKRAYKTFDSMLQTNKTRAFLVLEDDRIIY